MKEITIADYWPTEKPNTAPLSHGWLGEGNKTELTELITNNDVKYMAELGSWYGLSAKFLMELTKKSHVELGSESESESVQKLPMMFCIDYWILDFVINQFKDFVETHKKTKKQCDILQQSHPLYETFLVNLWDYQKRLVPLRMSTLEGLQQLVEWQVPLDLIYIDATHTYEAVMSEIETCLKLFPKAIVCGDDWKWGGVQAAVKSASEKFGFQYKVTDNFWQITSTSVQV